MSEIFYDQKSGQYFYNQPQGYGRYNPWGGMGMMGMMNYRRPAMPAQPFAPSMIDKWMSKPKYQPNAPTLYELFGGMSAPSDYAFQNSYAQPAQSSGAGRFTGLLGGK